MKRENTVNTDKLLSELKEESNLNTFWEKNTDTFVTENVPTFLNQMMTKYNINKNKVIANSDIERSYCYQILRGTRNASRDNYIKLAFGIGLNLDDTQTLLRISKTSPLYVKLKRDAAIIFCINKNFDLKETQALLYNQGLKILE